MSYTSRTHQCRLQRVLMFLSTCITMGLAVDAEGERGVDEKGRGTSRMVFVTDGLLLELLKHDKRMDECSVFLIDEVRPPQAPPAAWFRACKPARRCMRACLPGGGWLPVGGFAVLVCMAVGKCPGFQTSRISYIEGLVACCSCH
jgi:hypothetical protein